jgi:hypothetical protein
MPVCSRSGYALLTDDDEVFRFEATGNQLAEKLVEKHSRTLNWRVSVEGIVEVDRLEVRHLKLLKPN